MAKSQIKFGELEVQSRAYCLPINDIDTFMKIQDDLDLCEKLEAVSAFNIEANGHFGAAVFYSLYSEDDKPETHSAVREVLQNIV